MKSLKPTANFWIILATIICLAIAYYAYLEFYVTAKENRIITTRFRVLDQLGDNINDKIKSYNSNALELKQKIVEKIKYYEYRLNSQNPNDTITKETISQWVYEKYKDGSLTKYSNKDLEVEFVIDKGMADQITKKEIQKKRVTRKDTDTYYYFSPVQIKITDTISRGLITEFYDTLVIRTSYKNIMKGLIRYDVFDELLIVRDDKIVFTTLNSDLLLKSSDLVKFTDAEKGETGAREDQKQESAETVSQADFNKRIVSGTYTDLVLSNKRYKLFYKPFKIGEETWYAGGLMEVNTINVAKRSLAPGIIILASMLLILIMLSLPLIKLKVISNTEQLSTGTVINSALSLLLGLSAITLFVVYLSTNLNYSRQIDNRLKALAFSVDTTFMKELDSVVNQICYYDSIIANKIFKIDSLSPRNPNKILNDISNLVPIHPAFPASYHFPDVVFWANAKGEQTQFLTSNNDPDAQMSKIGHRDYFRFKDQWFFPPDSALKFRMESILSISTGSHKVAVSMASRAEENEVIAMTSRFYSIMDPILPMNYGYCIIDESGRVWFHSKKERNLMENFIEECNNIKYIQAAIYNLTSKPMHAFYYNTPHRVYIQPLKQIPLYLVTFYDKNNQTSIVAQEFTVTLFLLGAFFFILFLQTSVLLILEKKVRQEPRSQPDR